MRNAVDVISVHKVDNEEKISSMEARLNQLSTSVLSRIEAVEKVASRTSFVANSPGGSPDKSPDGFLRHTDYPKPPEGMQVLHRQMSAPAASADHRAHAVAKADRKLEQQMASLQSRMRNAVDVISVHKVDHEEKFNSMEARLNQLSTSVLSRIEAVEKTASRTQAVATSSGGSRDKSGQFEQGLEVPDRTKTRLPPSESAAQQNEEKRLLAKAMVMMERKLENFVTAENFHNLREHVDGGLSNIGEQIKSAHDAQIEKTESMLDEILVSRARSTSRSRPRARSSVKEEEG
jgi:hypothetical protein